MTFSTTSTFPLVFPLIKIDNYIVKCFNCSSC